jgi:hypothetical protein
MTEATTKKRGGPAKSQEEKKVAQEARQIAKEVVETIKEVIKYVPEPRLEGFALYKALKDKGYYQGGMGMYMEDMNGTEKVYVPHTSEVYAYFLGDPDKWEALRDAMIRAYIELQ